MFAVCCCSLLTLASSSVYKPRLVFPAQLIRTKTSGVRAGEGICSEHSPLTQPRAARLNRTRPNPPNPRFSGEPWLFLFCLSHACSVRLGPNAPVLGDPKSQGWVPLPQWNSRLEIKVPVLSSALPCPKESGRDSCPLSHHGDSAFCRNARTFQLPGGKSSLHDTPSERCPSDTSLTPLLPISDTAGRKEINQSRTRGRQEGAQEGERFWVDSSRAVGKWRAGMGRGSGLSLPGGGSSLQTANALACESPSISTNDAIREGGGGTRSSGGVSTNLHTGCTLPSADTVAPSNTPMHTLHRQPGPRTSVGTHALFAQTTSMHMVRDPLLTAGTRGRRVPIWGFRAKENEKPERLGG